MLQKNDTTKDYFLAGKNVGWFVIGASIFASNIGSERILWKRINAPGAIATLLFGLLIGTLRIIAELSVQEGGSGIVHTFAMINFAHMAIFMFLACVIVCIVVSLMTPAPSEAQIAGLTFGTLTEAQKSSAKNNYSTKDLIASAILVIAIISIFIYFTG